MPKSYYDILGVSKSASADEIKRAYRKKAHEFHPDKGTGNEEKFKEANEAYQVLSDASKRQQYDQFGTTAEEASRSGRGGGFGGFSGQGYNPFEGFSGAGFGGMGQGGMEFDLGDIFSDLFGGGRHKQSRRRRGVDLEMPLQITFEEAFFGVTKTVTLEKSDACQSCGGTGAENNSKTIVCPKCHGQGQVVVYKNTLFGRIQSASACDNCDGLGNLPEKACQACAGVGVLKRSKTLQINIPAGIDNNQRIRIAGEGEAGYKGSGAGDLYISVKVLPSKEFIRHENDLHKDVKIGVLQAVLGVKLEIKALNGNLEVKIPAGTQSGTVLKVGGRGFPDVNSGRHGDLLLKIQVEIPTKLSKKEKELLQEWASLRGEDVSGASKGFWS